MTNKEVIKILNALEICNFEYSNICEAIEIAIEALKQEPKTGHWIKSNIPNEEYVCSECGGASWYYDYQANVTRSKHCPNCGALMESEDK